jgi:acyl-CoA thioesterase
MKAIFEVFEKDRFAKSCGIEISEMSPGFGKCTMEITEKHLNGLDMVMGGAIFTLADFTFSVAANNQGDLGVSLNVNISFLKKCNGRRLTAIAREISRSKHIGVYNICVQDENERQIADATGTCYFLKGESVS